MAKATQLTILDLEGDDALNVALQQLPFKVQKKVLVSAVTKASTPLVRAVRVATPVGRTGNLKASVKKIIRRRTRKGIMALVGNAWPIGAHAHLVERGTKQRQKKKTGKNTGKMPAKPYVAPIYNAQKAGVEQKLKTLIAQGIEKEAEKLANAS